MADVALTHAPQHRRYSLRFNPQADAPAAPAGLGEAVVQGDRIALGLGPDEWLILGPASGAALPAPQIAAAFSWVDVSHRQIGLILSGPDVETVLNLACPRDLCLTAFPVGACSRTVMGKAEVVLWRKSATQFHIEVWRSFADYVEALITAGAGETL